MKLTANDAPGKICTRLVGSRRGGNASCSGVAAVGLSRCVNLPPFSPGDCERFVGDRLFSRLSVQLRGARLPGKTTRSVPRRYRQCRRLVGSLTSVSLRLLKVKHGKRVNFGRPNASFRDHARIISLTRDAHGTGTEFFGSVRSIPTRTVAVKVTSVLSDQRVVLLTSNSTGTRTVERLICKRPSRRFPTSTLGLRRGIAVVTSRRTLDLIDGS